MSAQVIDRSRTRRRARISAISSLSLLLVVAGAAFAMSISSSETEDRPRANTPAHGGTSPTPEPSTTTPAESSEGVINVFLLREDAPTPFDKESYEPVERTAGSNRSTEGNLGRVLGELVKGPLPQERVEGLTSVFTEETSGIVHKVEVVDGVATIDFDDFGKQIPGASSSQGATTLIFQLNLTVFQFEEIKEVNYLIDGDCSQFWNFLQAECQSVTREAWESADIEVDQ